MDVGVCESVRNKDERRLSTSALSVCSSGVAETRSQLCFPSKKIGFTNMPSLLLIGLTAIVTRILLLGKAI
jgi:hypothetical protein